MKILKLKFKNLNSLENENTINFEEAPFSDTGVFAITGPNGSGKSTILDAITLGLYGETFRFDRPAEHVMTKNSADCYAEIEFSIGKEKYRSIWQAQRSGGNPEAELQPSEMKLTRLNGNEEVLAVTPKQVCAKIADITGMNFRSFTRSILLAQGDFAAFLNALDNERLDILEKIISTDIYADYQKDILTKAEDAEKVLAYLKQDLTVIPVLEPLKREACEHDLADFQEQFADFQREHDALKQQQAALFRIEEMRSQVADQGTALEALKLATEAEQKKLDELASGRIALNFKDDLQAIKAADESLQQSKESLASFRNELKQLETRLAEVDGNHKTLAGAANLSFSEQQQTIANTRAQVNLLNSNLQSAIQLAQSLAVQVKNKTSELTTTSAWLAEHAADQALVESFPELARLKKLKQELAVLAEKHKAISKWSAKAALIQKKNSSVLEKQQKAAEDLKRRFADEENEFIALAQGKTFQEIQELRSEQQERMASVRELIRLADAHQKLDGGNGFFGFFKGKEELPLNADELDLELQKLRQELKREENIKLALEELVFGEELRQKMAADRHHVADGKPCPLCGSLEHPYARNPPPQTNSKQALIDQHGKIKRLKAQADQTERNIGVAKKQTEQSRIKQNRLQLLRSQWLTLCNRLNVATQDLDINKHKLMKRLLKNEIIELTHIASLAGKYRKKQQVLEKLKTSIAKTTAAIEQLQADGQQLAADWQIKTDERAAVEAALADCRQQEIELSGSLLEQLTLLGEQMPITGKEELLLERLNARLQEYQALASRQQVLKEELAILAEKEKNCQAEIKAYDEQLGPYNNQLQSEEATGLHLALIEKQKLIAGQEKQISRQQSEVANLQRILDDKMRGTIFANPKQIDEMLELLQSEPELVQRKAELDHSLMLKAQELEKMQAQLTVEQAQGLTASSSEEISAQLRSVKEKMDIAYQEALRLDALLKDQDRLQQQYDAILLRLLDQEKVVQDCVADKALLEVDQGMVFRRRVQSQIADKLLSASNTVLEKISGRYYLRRKPGEQGLALEIEDTLQANARRMPKTLSGGESFVVSLALALGLSELVNNGKSIDSLFLDEGFGNLDAEALYTVINTLERLQTHGKTVGVISHVEAVQKSIKVQLQVIKKPNGMGMLKKAS